MNQKPKQSEPVRSDDTFTRNELERNRRAGFVTPSGVVYEEYLAGSAGMRFVLLRDDLTTDEMLAQAVRELRSARDVVGRIAVASVIP